MDALISAQAGTALLIEGTKLASIHAHAPEQAIPRRAEEVHLLFGEGLDLQVLQGVDRDQVVRRLAREADSAEALQLSLILLDPELPGEIRSEGAEELDDLLAEDECRKGLESVLYAHPFPPEADLSGALAHSEGHARVQDLLRQLIDLQPSIAEVRSAWTDLPDTLFVNPAERQRFQAALVREGLFRELVLVRQAGTAVESFLVSALLHPVVRRIQGYRPAMQAWTAPFRRHERATDWQEQVSEVTEDVVPRGRKRVSFDRKAAFERTEIQKQAIMSAMKSGDFSRAREYISNLVENQLAGEGAEYAAKSLCDLAMKAKDLGLTEFQLKLTEKSVEVKPDNGWAWAQHGDALLTVGAHDSALEAFGNAISFGYPAVGFSGQAEVMRSLGRLDEALEFYDSVVKRYPDDVVARSGHAETLRDLKWLDQALKAYEDVVERFPNDVVARTGHAETLRELGRLEQALQAYEDVIERFPNDVVARNGYAETLRELGRLEQALQAYEGSVKRFPNDAFARNGRAETLRSLGRLEDALAAYDAVIERFPHNLVARNGRAGVLGSMGRWEDALERLPNTSPVHSEDWIGYHIRGMALLRLGRLEEAERVFRDGVENCPLPTQRDYFRTAMAALKVRRQEYSDASAVLEGVDTSALKPQVDLLRLHSFGAEGEQAKAVATERQIQTAQASPEFHEVREELKRRYIEHLPARHSEEWLLEREVALLLAAVVASTLFRRRTR